MVPQVQPAEIRYQHVERRVTTPRVIAWPYARFSDGIGVSFRGSAAHIFALNFKEVRHMLMALFLLLILFGFPLSTLAQFIDKGDRVEVVKGTRLCSNVKMEKAKGSRDPGRVSWRVTSKMRSNGTQTVAAFVHEDVYDSKSGDTRIKETLYQEDYATFFKRDPEHKGMLLMISPQDGRVEAIVEVCEKK
jgi:hypothetical protein